MNLKYFISHYEEIRKDIWKKHEAGEISIRFPKTGDEFILRLRYELCDFLEYPPFDIGRRMAMNNIRKVCDFLRREIDKGQFKELEPFQYRMDLLFENPNDSDPIEMKLPELEQWIRMYFDGGFLFKPLKRRRHERLD